MTIIAKSQRIYITVPIGYPDDWPRDSRDDRQGLHGLISNHAHEQITAAAKALGIAKPDDDDHMTNAAVIQAIAPYVADLLVRAGKPTLIGQNAIAVEAYRRSRPR